MSKIEIDNKRMWESILSFKCEVKTEDVKNNPAGIAIKCIGDSIKHALKEQGLEYENGKIRYSTWYKCISSFETAHDRFEEGESYRYCDTVRRNLKYFRLDTECHDVPETDFGSKSDDLTEFEKAIGLEIFDPPFNEEHIKVIKEESSKLIAIARKELESEGRIGITRAEFESELEHLYKYADEVQYNRGHDDGYEAARKDFLEQIEHIVTNPKLFDEDRVYDIEKLIKELKGE